MDGTDVNTQGDLNEVTVPAVSPLYVYKSLPAELDLPVIVFTEVLAANNEPWHGKLKTEEIGALPRNSCL